MKKQQKFKKYICIGKSDKILGFPFVTILVPFLKNIK